MFPEKDKDSDSFQSPPPRLLQAPPPHCHPGTTLPALWGTHSSQFQTAAFWALLPAPVPVCGSPSPPARLALLCCWSELVCGRAAAPGEALPPSALLGARCPVLCSGSAHALRPPPRDVRPPLLTGNSLARGVHLWPPSWTEPGGGSCSRCLHGLTRSALAGTLILGSQSWPGRACPPRGGLRLLPSSPSRLCRFSAARAAGYHGNG